MLSNLLLEKDKQNSTETVMDGSEKAQDADQPAN